MMRRCPVTGGLPTRMSYDGFVAACLARRGRSSCEGWCGGMPQELEIIKGGLEMGKTSTIKEQIAEALAPVKAALEDRQARVAVLEDQVEGLERRCEELRGVCKAAYNLLCGEGGEAYANADDILPRIVALQSEVAALRAAAAPQPDIDLSAVIYRDALADFAIRVLSGGVAVSFREPTA